MSTAEVRKLAAGEELAFVASVKTPFLDPPTGDPESTAQMERWAADKEVDRAWVAEANGRFVANCCTYTMDLTLPSAPGQACPVIAMAGVSAVGVHPTHRRQGLLTKMMAEMLSDARQRGEPVAGLVASESVIYGRFGFGHATSRADLTIDTGRSRFSRPVPPLELDLLERHEAAKVVPAIFDRQRRNRAGEPNRTVHDWEAVFADRPDGRSGGRGAFFAVCDRGYVQYRAHHGDVLHADYNTVVIEELYGETAAVEAALWRFVLDLDLVGRVRAKRRPVDDPVRWRLADPRQLATERMDDFLWLRILDVPAALTARRYRRPGRLVLDLTAPPVGYTEPDPATGRWVLEAGRDGAACRPARDAEEPDLRMEVTDLGSLYLGGFPASVLAAAGRVTELTAGSLDVADALFSTPLAPYTGTGF